MNRIEFELDREFVALNDLLKLAGVCDSGGMGKALVAAGEVSVDGQRELRKTAKIEYLNQDLAQGARAAPASMTTPRASGTGAGADTSGAGAATSPAAAGAGGEAGARPGTGDPAAERAAVERGVSGLK